MADELVFTVSGAEAKPVRATTLLEIGLSERYHLQEWVLAHPEILGPDIAVVTFSEFSTLASVLTNEGMRGALDLCASRPGEWVTYLEISEYTGRSRAELRANLGALTHS